jgi:hypothetical protein
MRHVLYEGSNQISSYYSLSAEEKTWTTRFEPLLDPSQWPVYGGQDYVPDMAMRKMRKGRRKKKRFRNEMDDMEKGYGNDMYGSGDFDQTKIKYIVPSVTVKATLWIDISKGQNGTQGRVPPREEA